MSSTKHTLGPWFLTEGPTYGYTSTLKIEAPITEENKYGMVICERHVPSYDTGIRPECMANARLIAAAPDLLRELMSAREKLFNDTLSYNQGVLKASFEKSEAHAKLTVASIDAVIAKVTLPSE